MLVEHTKAVPHSSGMMRQPRFGTFTAIVGASDGLRSATQWCSASKQRDADKVCWQLSLETQPRAAYAGSADLQSMHASHTERAGQLRGGLREVGGP